MAKRFNVQYQRQKDSRNAKKGDWVSIQRKWRGKKTDEFSYKKARLLTKSLRQSLGDENVRIKMVKPPRPKRLTKRQREQQLVAKWLRGDLDAQHKLLYALALVARELGYTLYVAEGKRTVAQQWKYWRAYKNGTGPLAAFPGTSNHTWGRAADVRKNKYQYSGNIGNLKGARSAMKKRGLSLPVPGETWHVEFSTR